MENLGKFRAETTCTSRMCVRLPSDKDDSASGMLVSLALGSRAACPGALAVEKVTVITSHL